MLNLDTHIVIHSVMDELSECERSLIISDECGIAGIVLWEISKLHQHGRIAIGLDDGLFLELLSTLRIWPLNLDVARRLKDLDFHSDPADEIIAATSLMHNVPLLTRDRTIRRSKVVPLAG